MNAAKLTAIFASGVGIGFGLCGLSLIARQGAAVRGPNYLAAAGAALCVLCLLGLLISGIAAILQAIFGKNK